MQRTARARFGFPKERRLRRPPEFQAVHAEGRRCADGFFTATLRLNDRGAARLGLAVSLKATGNAVARNRVRRLVRESFRLHLQSLPPVDIVVAARSRVREASARDLQASLAGLWKRIAKQCAPSSAA